MSDIANESPVVTESIATDPVSAFSFENAHAKALEMWEGTPSAEPTEQPVAAQEPVAEPATNVDDASAQQLAQLADDQLVEVTVDGEKVTMPWKDARAGVMRQAHYTKNMQALRQEQSQFEAQRQAFTEAQQQRDALASLIQSEDLLKQFLQKQYPHLLQHAQAIEQAQQQVDPNDIATVGQLQELAQLQQQNTQQFMEAFKQELQKELVTATQELETRAATAKLAESINATVNDIFTEHAYLKEIVPDAEQVLRYQVAQLNPRTAEETLQAFKDVAAGWVENFERQVASRNKASVIQQHKLKTNNIQPPGGTQVQPQPTSFQKTNPFTGKNEVDWTALNRVAMGVLEGK